MGWVLASVLSDRTGIRLHLLRKPCRQRTVRQRKSPVVESGSLKSCALSSAQPCEKRSGSSSRQRTELTAQCCRGSRCLRCVDCYVTGPRGNRPLAQAALKGASNDRIILAMRSGASQQTQAQKKWSARHPLLHAVLLTAAFGAAIGAGLGALGGGGDADAEPPVKPHRLQAAGAGAVLGGGIGALLIFGYSR